MIPRANITAWRAQVSWPDDPQVEQDLVLSRTIVELFSQSQLKDKIALRGGTALQKLFLDPPCRYSEDIDLVQTTAGPIGPILDAIRQCLDPWLAVPTRKRAKDGVSLTYRFQSETAPVRPLRLKIEINTREHFSVFGYRLRDFHVENPWFSGHTQVATYELDELLGTKLRALYQRRKGRDLFDLWLCLDRNLVQPERVVTCFSEYLHNQDLAVSRAQFEQNLHDKQGDPAFIQDIMPLLRPDMQYEPATAIDLVMKALIAKLPGAPWRGVS